MLRFRLQGEGQNFRRRCHRVEGKFLAYRPGQFHEVLFVLFRQNHFTQTGAVGGQDLFLHAAKGRTFPRSVISPVMAISRRTLRLVRAEARAVIIVTPAEGPSFGIAPSGTWM